MSQCARHQGHANLQAVPYLFFNQRSRPIGDRIFNLEASNHRPRVHHPKIRMLLQPRRMQLKVPAVRVQIEVQPRQPFRLDAQHHHDLRCRQGLVQIALDRDAGSDSRSDLRQQRLRSAKRSRGRRAAAATARSSAPPGCAGCLRRSSGSRRQASSHRPLSHPPAGRGGSSADPAAPAKGARCMPSPAFSTGKPVTFSSSHGDPDAAWRRMIASAPSARSVSPVSLSDSPFSMLDAWS